jgi:hypothetical protein
MNSKFSAKQKTITAIAIIILMASLVISTIPVQAQTAQISGGAPQSSSYTGGPLPAGVTPNDTIETIAYLSVSPNPIGVGQLLLVNMGFNRPLLLTELSLDTRSSLQNQMEPKIV